MNLFCFGKKRKAKRSIKTNRKPPAKLLKMCKKYKIKVSVKRNGKRVYKSKAVLKKLLKQKMRKMRKSRKSRKTLKTRKIVKRKFHFGMGAFTQPDNFGYNQPVEQTPGVLSQSSMVVTPQSNINRPPGFGLDESSLPVFGVGRPFFGSTVPAVIPPSWNFMGQPDGSMVAVGSPFVRYTSFGKKKYIKNR